MKKLFILCLLFLLSACSIPVANESPIDEKFEEQLRSAFSSPDQGKLEETIQNLTKVDRVINISAKRFEFTPNVIRIKKGETVRFNVDNTDTNHDFMIPELNLSSNDVLKADKPGEYEFLCANFCGEGHRLMKGTIVIEE